MFTLDYFWNPKSDAAVEIRTKWKELPTTFFGIDAVFENKDKTVWFFIGTSVYVFNYTTFLKEKSLQDFGIDRKYYSKIDAIFRWPYNDQVYIFSGEDYWLLEGSKVSGDYPKKILSSWKDVYDVDTVFSKDDNLFILKDEYFHEFDTSCMNINRMARNKIGIRFLNCHGTVRKRSDVVPITPTMMCLPDDENIEKGRKLPDAEVPPTEGRSNVITTLPAHLTKVVSFFMILLFINI